MFFFFFFFLLGGGGGNYSVFGINGIKYICSHSVHRSLIRNKRQTAVINIINERTL